MAFSFGTEGTNAQRLAIQDDGNLVLYGADNRLVLELRLGLGNASFFLNPGQAMLPGDLRVSLDGTTRMVMQDDGNLVVYATSGKALFSTR